MQRVSKSSKRGLSRLEPNAQLASAFARDPPLKYVVQSLAGQVADAEAASHGSDRVSLNPTDDAVIGAEKKALMKRIYSFLNEKLV